MKVLITGAGGQLGRDISEYLIACGDNVIACGRDQLDITDSGAVQDCVTACMPEAIIHCAAFTDVDKAETEQKACTLTNVFGTMNVVNAAQFSSADLLYISSDYVFGDDSDRPLEIDTLKDPKNIYGMSKLSGEKEVVSSLDNYFILRTSWVFGLHGVNFINSLMRRARDGEVIRVVQDQVGAPTYTRDLAVLIRALLQSKKYGIYHASNEGECSRYELAMELFRQLGWKTKVLPVSSEESSRTAIRQKNSRLSKTSLTKNGFSLLPPWENALSRYLQELPEAEKNFSSAFLF